MSSQQISPQLTSRHYLAKMLTPFGLTGKRMYTVVDRVHGQVQRRQGLIKTLRTLCLSTSLKWSDNDLDREPKCVKMSLYCKRIILNRPKRRDAIAQTFVNCLPPSFRTVKKNETTKRLTSAKLTFSVAG